MVFGLCVCLCVSAWRSEADSRCRSAVQLKAVLTVEQAGGQQGALVLWGAAVDWLHRFNRDRGRHTHLYRHLGHVSCI